MEVSEVIKKDIEGEEILRPKLEEILALCIVQ